LHNYQVINSSGRNYVLIAERIGHSGASAQIYDLDQEKIVGVIPSFSMAAKAKPVYLLPSAILHSDSMKCYDYDGNLIEQTVFPEEGYFVESVAVVDDSTAIVNLQGGYLQGQYKGQGYKENIYIKVYAKN